MKVVFTFLMLTVFFVVCIGCGDDDENSVDNTDPESFFPLNIGNQWVWYIDDSDGQRTGELTVIDIADYGIGFDITECEVKEFEGYGNAGTPDITRPMQYRYEDGVLLCLDYNTLEWEESFDYNEIVEFKPNENIRTVEDSGYNEFSWYYEYNFYYKVVSKNATADISETISYNGCYHLKKHSETSYDTGTPPLLYDINTTDLYIKPGIGLVLEIKTSNDIHGNSSSSRTELIDYEIQDSNQ